MFKFRKNPLEETFEDIEKAPRAAGLMKRIEGSPKATTAIVCAGVALVLVAGAAATAAMVGTDPSAKTSAADAADAATVDTAPQTMTIDVTADDGWTSTSTPAIVHITGRTATGSADSDEDIDFYHAVNPSADNAGSDDIELAPGVYAAETISPLNADGSAYTVWKTGEAKRFAVGFDDEDKAKAAEGDAHCHAYAECNDCHGRFDLYGDGDEASEWEGHADETGHTGYVRHAYACTETDCAYAKLEQQGDRYAVQMEKVPADQVTDEMVKDIVDKTTQAVAGGDSSLKGDAGKGVLEKLDANAKSNANASDETKASAEAAKETTDTSGEGGKTGGSGTGAADGGSGKGSASAGSSDGGSGKGGASGSGKGDAHAHSWVASTHTVHHDAVTHVVHHDAVTHTENVTKTVTYYVCNDCGYGVTAEEAERDAGYEFNDFEGHMVYNGHGAYHFEDKTVVVGTNTVVDSAAWDETVTDTPAWDETVVDGYSCSTCGSAK